MICARPACNGDLRIYRTVELKIQNVRHHYASCQNCGKKYVLETRIRREVKRQKKANR